MLKAYFLEMPSLEALNFAVFEVQKRIWHYEKVFISQRTINKVAYMCLENGVYTGWYSLYVNCIADGLEALKDMDRSRKVETA